MTCCAHVSDNSHTYPHFTYNHSGFSIQTHKFDKTRGKIVLDRAAPTVHRLPHKHSPDSSTSDTRRVSSTIPARTGFISM